MQVGSFHECYSTDQDGLDLVNIAQQLDIICTKKNSKDSVSASNPRMLGFPVYTTDNFIEKLINLNFTVVKIDQVSEPPKPKREVVGIYSPATFIHTKISNKTNYLSSIVIDKIKNNICIGLASYDLSTGYGYYYEVCSKKNDPMLSLDDAVRFLNTYSGKEVIIYHTFEDDEQINNMDITNILNYIGCNEKMLFDYKNKNSGKLAFQKLLFEKIFKKSNIFEILNLHLYNWARLALTILYDYAEQHQNLLIDKLKLPVEFETNNILYLGNNALDQLDVFQKEKGLFNIINYTKTLLGKRFLNQSLLKPLIDVDDIKKRNEYIERLIENNYYESLGGMLEDISDLEKLIRKIELIIMHPYELNLLYVSIYQINKIMIFCQKNDLFDISVDNSLNNLTEYIENTFYLEKLVNLNFSNFNDYEDTIFKSKYPEIDLLYQNIQNCTNFMDNLIEKLTELMDEKNSSINLKHNDRDGYYLMITSRRCAILKKKLPETIKIGSIILQTDQLQFTEMPKSTYTKITCDKIKNLSNELIIHKNKMAKLTKDKFKEELVYILEKFETDLNYWSNKISYIDFIYSGSVCAIKNHYTKPNIIVSNESYFNSIEMRHPIVEKINNDFSYKPHNISLGEKTEQNGLLLFGINSSGKSTLMKSIGLNIILAQIGYFTACKYLELSPYKSLFTRINSNDNLFKGLSSFMVEMIELTSILKRNNENTLILADEIARGSESKSANIIVTYMLKTLSEAKSSFITATHLHELVHIPTVKKLKNVKIKHIKITLDDENNKLIYDRELSDGSGSSFYGLQVAKYLMNDPQFNKITMDICNEYENIDIKQSRYNSNVYLIECEICKSKNKLETHHIIPQKDFNNKLINKNELHIQKNANYNLVCLCQTCHDLNDNNTIIIKGWDETNKGRVLNFSYNLNIEKRNKYTDKMIHFIRLLKDTLDTKLARIKIYEEYDIKVSTNTIKSIWNNIN
jgi:DNA mismatch repair protein MutS